MSGDLDNGRILYHGFGGSGTQVILVVCVCKNVCIPIAHVLVRLIRHRSAFSLSSELAESQGTLLPMVRGIDLGGV
jgi:hypothetical protein